MPCLGGTCLALHYIAGDCISASKLFKDSKLNGVKIELHGWGDIVPGMPAWISEFKSPELI